MLAIRQHCENCKKSLPYNSLDARICSYECTFCVTCVTEILQNVCPNCGGGFEKRPVRPKAGLLKNPPSEKVVYKPVDVEVFTPLLDKLKSVKPEER